MTISNWEKGKNTPNQKHYDSLLSLFEVKADYFRPEHRLLVPFNQLLPTNAGTGYSYFGDGNFDVVFYDEQLDYDFASWVFGDSMEPTYLNGEVVLIKQDSFDYDGAIYAVEWDGQTYIKKVYREEDGLRLVSLNKKYSDKFAPYDEEPRIIGKIIANFMPLEV